MTSIGHDIRPTSLAEYRPILPLSRGECHT
jgi:hypothetical protein